MSEILIFVVIVAAMLWLDLRGHRDRRPVTLRGAAIWSVVWVAVSLGFAAYLYVNDGAKKAGPFTAGYLLEKSLSVDNLFVIAAIFASFNIKGALQHRILYYGILGAIVFRLVFISLGAAFLLVGQLHPVANIVVYSLFGALVIWSALTMLKNTDNEASNDEDFTEHWSIRFFRNGLHLPVSCQLNGDKFFVRSPEGKRLATPLFLCLIVVETSDIAFAFDSVPAVIAVTKDPFLVYTSNIFAILGLRSMYFLLVAAKNRLCHLEKAVVGILLFIGLKMFVEAFQYPLSEALGIQVHIPVAVSLSVVVGGLIAGVVASYVYPEKQAEA